MGYLTRTTPILGLAAAAAVLAACSGAQPLTPSGATPLQSNSSRASNARALPPIPPGHAAVIPHPDRSKSWMAKGADDTALLYLSDFFNGDVYVYAWPKLAPVGTLTGFNNPTGLCVDRAQHIWITNESSSNLIEYAHGGTTPIATLNDAGYYPVGCAIDKQSGTLAASNITDTSSGPGGLTIYRNARGTGNVYTNPLISYAYFLGYDPNGRLFVDGLNSSGNFQLAKFNHGTFTPIAISGGTINFPGGVQYVDHALTVDDQNGPSGYSVIYRMSEKGVISGSTPMTMGMQCVQTFIRVKSVVCPDDISLNFQLYAYPAGGTPRATITGSFSLPIGAAVSL